MEISLKRERGILCTYSHFTLLLVLRVLTVKLKAKRKILRDINKILATRFKHLIIALNEEL